MRSSDLYAHYHSTRNDERLGLFELLVAEFGVTSGLYAGCFVHVTPSFVIPEMVYVDSDKRAAAFFASASAKALVADRKKYEAEPRITFIRQDYRKPLAIPEESVDLLISQYAGFVSEHCLPYVRPGGYLVANNSHGDAGVAETNARLELVAVVKRRGERFSLSSEHLDDYFVPKSRSLPDDPTDRRATLMELGRGVGYAKAAADYVFRRREAANE